MERGFAVDYRITALYRYVCLYRLSVCTVRCMSVSLCLSICFATTDRHTVQTDIVRDVRILHTIYNNPLLRTKHSLSRNVNALTINNIFYGLRIT